MIDLHTHILPELDDGAPGIQESVAIARAMLAEGARVVAGTPHVRDDFPTSPDEMEAAVQRLRDALQAEGLPLQVVSGGEIAMDRVGRLTADDLRRFSLGGGNVLLLESPYGSWPLGIDMLFVRLRQMGFRALVAHPERNLDVRREPERLRPLVEMGVLFQVTAAALAGRMGREGEKTSRALVDAGLAQVIASDAHGHAGRPPSLREAAASLGDQSLARWLCTDVPEAILLDRPVPERPEGKPKQPTRFRRLGRGRHRA